MILLDSNIFIEWARAGNEYPIARFVDRSLFSSVISRVEVLGYHRLAPQDRADLEILFDATTEIALDREIVDCAIRLRQSRKSGLGDSLIAATN